MSRHISYRGDGTLVAFGFDAPTGGYFWSQVNDLEQEIGSENGLTLTTLLNIINEKFSISPSTKDLVEDFVKAEMPSGLQINVGKMFGYDIVSMLKEVEKDINTNYLFLPI